MMAMTSLPTNPLSRTAESLNALIVLTQRPHSFSLSAILTNFSLRPSVVPTKRPWRTFN